MENYTFIYTPWASNSKKFLKELSIYTHCAPKTQNFKLMCVNVHPCVNYEWSKIQLRVNENPTKNEFRLN